MHTGVNNTTLALRIPVNSKINNNTTITQDKYKQEEGKTYMVGPNLA